MWATLAAAIVSLLGDPTHPLTAACAQFTGEILLNILESLELGFSRELRALKLLERSRRFARRMSPNSKLNPTSCC